MRFNPKARLNRGQVQNRRGSFGGSTGGGFPVAAGGRGLRVGGGIGGVIVLIIIVVLNSGILGTAPDSGQGGPVSTGSQAFDQCRSGADANRDADCARVAIVNSIQSFWSQELPQQTGREYAPVDTIIFSGQVSTGCGRATSAAGPFYCPVDKLVYLDTTFFQDMLEQQLGGSGADFAQAYVLAHEYGHHVQDLLGTLGRVRTQQGANSDAVRLELQADCYAGIWTRFATEAEDRHGNVFITGLDPSDVEEALSAARAVGDDRIQQQATGRVDPDAWTHGSAEQRMRWFGTGRDTGSLEACDTFSVGRL